MGADQTSNFSAKKKRKRTADRKFNFEWNTEEDTSGDYNPLYQHRHEAKFFGRGRLAGFGDDVADDVAREYAEALVSRDHEAGSARAKEILEMERRRREESTRTQIDKHWSEKRLDLMRERDWRIFKEDFNIATKGGSVPNPMRSWEESLLPKRLLELVDRVGYKDPTPIQRAAIPIAMQSRDLIGVAVTGSGKTAAFLLPLLVYISELPRLDENEWRKNDGPYAIVLAPTRELAQQIEIEAKKFTQPLGFNVVSIVGGHSIEEQAFSLRDGAEIIIATPGRLVDCIERRMLVLSQCCYVIMDEADRMIDLGFEEPVNKILDALPVTNEKPDTDEAENSRAMSQHRYRQTMMYTATMPAAVERIARKYLRRPAIITIGGVGEAVDTVEQRVEMISGEDKRKKRLGEILSSGEFRPPIIVFVNIKRNCDAIAREIKQMGFSSVTLHGSKTQDQREAALASVRNGSTDVLVATDLAGRGIDVPDVSLVINFNMAGSIESYTHRIGRTGRAGKSGVAITFLGSEDSDVMYVSSLTPFLYRRDLSLLTNRTGMISSRCSSNRQSRASPKNCASTKRRSLSPTAVPVERRSRTVPGLEAREDGRNPFTMVSLLSVLCSIDTTSLSFIKCSNMHLAARMAIRLFLGRQSRIQSYDEAFMLSALDLQSSVMYHGKLLSATWVIICLVLYVCWSVVQSCFARALLCTLLKG